MGLAEEILKRVGTSKELMKSVAHALKGKTNSPDHLSNSIDTAYQVASCGYEHGTSLGCTDTPFLASCSCPTRVGHRNGYDAPDSGVRQCLFFFFFFRFSDTVPTRLRRGSDTAPTRLRRVRQASSEKKKKKEKKHRF